jgi:hypothetical protein
MAASYCTIANVKAADRLNITSTASDTILTDLAEAVSRWIDGQCGRHFYSEATSRYFTAQDHATLYCDDISTSSSLTVYTDVNGDGTFETTWATTDYNLAPYNPASGWPYQSIERAYLGVNYWPTHRRGVKITAVFGWAAVPKEIEEAAIIQCERVFKRFATPLGSAGMSALGETRLQIPAADGDVQSLLAPFKRLQP